MQTIVLRTYNTAFSASIILTRLQVEGIHCYLKDEFVMTINPLLNNAVGGVKLEVEVQDAERAIGLLESFEEELMQMAICPSCRLTRFSLVKSLATPSIVVQLLSKLFGKKVTLEVKTFYECGNCHYKTDALPAEFAEQSTDPVNF